MCECAVCMGVREHGCVNACTSVRARDRVCDQVCLRERVNMCL